MARDRVRTTTRSIALLVVGVVIVGACSDDSEGSVDRDKTVEAAVDESTDADETTATTGAESTSTDVTTTTDRSGETSTANGAPTEQLVITDDQFTRDGGGNAWTVTGTLVRDGSTLCFSAEVTVDSAESPTGIGNGVQDCLDDIALTDFDGTMSVSTGTIDGQQRFGYVWGRTTTAVAELSMRFEDGETRVVPVHISGDLKLFVAVVDTSTHAADVSTLDAIGADGATLDSAPIRAFLRAGPTYPVVTPITLPPVTYPSVGDY